MTKYYINAAHIKLKYVHICFSIYSPNCIKITFDTNEDKVELSEMAEKIKEELSEVLRLKNLNFFNNLYTKTEDMEEVKDFFDNYKIDTEKYPIVFKGSIYSRRLKMR